MYEGQYYSTASFTISGSDPLTQFHAGRRVEYATITESVTLSGIYTPDVTNSGVTTSGVLISGSQTIDYYDYNYGLVKTADSKVAGSGYITTINLTPGSDAVPSGSTLYIKYGPGVNGAPDDTFPSTAEEIPIYWLGHLNEFVGSKAVKSTVTRYKLAISSTSSTAGLVFTFSTTATGTWVNMGTAGGSISEPGILTDDLFFIMNSIGKVKITHSGSTGAENTIFEEDLYSPGSIKYTYTTTVTGSEYIMSRYYYYATTSGVYISIEARRRIEENINPDYEE